MRALVTGANGVLGSALIDRLLFEKKHEIYAADIDKSNQDIFCLDIRDLKQVESAVSDFKPEIIFHFAAETNVDKCESEVSYAYMVNAMGTENVALACLKYNIPIVYISTGAVFDGRKEQPYTEFDNPNPVNIYGKAKWEGEKIIQNLLNRYFIIRTGWMMGGGTKDKKFVAKIFNLLKTKNEISVVTDKIGSPTFANDLVNGIMELVSLKRYGLYHMANQGSCSRYEIAKKIVEFMHKKNVIIKPIASEQFSHLAPRPALEAIENFKLNLLGICVMRNWEEALKEYVEILTQD